MKAKLLLGTLFLGVLVLAVGGFTVRRSHRAIRTMLHGRSTPQPVGTGRPAYA